MENEKYLYFEFHFPFLLSKKGCQGSEMPRGKFIFRKQSDGPPGLNYLQSNVNNAKYMQCKISKIN